MPTEIAYIDEPAPKERHRSAVPSTVTFAQASIPAIDADARKVYIGTPDRSAKAQAHTDWAVVKDKYQQERDSPEGSVDRSCEIIIVDEMDPDLGGGEDGLEELVGTRQANALTKAGYGTVQAAKALSKEALTEIHGVGEGTYESLHQDEE